MLKKTQHLIFSIEYLRFQLVPFFPLNSGTVAVHVLLIRPPLLHVFHRSIFFLIGFNCTMSVSGSSAAFSSGTIQRCHHGRRAAIRTARTKRIILCTIYLPITWSLLASCSSPLFIILLPFELPTQENAILPQCRFKFSQSTKLHPTFNFTSPNRLLSLYWG